VGSWGGFTFSKAAYALDLLSGNLGTDLSVDQKPQAQNVVFKGENDIPVFQFFSKGDRLPGEKSSNLVVMELQCPFGRMMTKNLNHPG